MAPEGQAPRSSKLGNAISSGKDLVSLVRDGLLLVLGVLLVIFPKQLNRVLSNAGFDHGSFMGIDWQTQLKTSTDTLQDTHDSISGLGAQYAAIAQKLQDLSAGTTDATVKEQIADLAQKNVTLNETATTMQKSVVRVLQANALVIGGDPSAPSSSQPSEYLVGLQTLGLPDNEREALNGQLHANGYGLHNESTSYQTTTRPAWFPSRSTVFYYALSAVSAADTLAGLMKKLTGQQFVTQRGAGSGVGSGQQAVTLFVDYVKDGP
jgi:hypothetical protein